MAAFVFFACNAVQQIYEFSVALTRNDFKLKKSVKYLQRKRELFLYRKYCCDVWQLCESDKKQQQKTSAKSAVITSTMKRQEIDFAAIEASAEAFDRYANDRYRPLQQNSRQTSQQSSAALDIMDLDVEVFEADEIDATFYEYTNAVPVHQENNIEQLYEGVSYTFTGYILVNCERFSINFVLNNETQDVALHINPRLPQNYIVRNTKVRSVWGREEVSSALPFSLRRGSKFSIQVLVTAECYMISVNGYHFVEYKHRLPYTAVTAIEVRGDVDNISVERSQVNSYPQRLPESEAKEIRLVASASSKTTPQSKDDSGIVESDYDEVDGTCIPKEWRQIPTRCVKAITSNSSLQNAGLSLPYYGKFAANSLVEGKCLKIEGRVKLLPHSFYINLQQGTNIWPHPVVAFHLNPRFSKHAGAMGKAIVCRNAWYNGAWAQEERSELVTDFRPGKTFSLVIACASNAFEVYVNRKLITEFNYHVKPEIVNTVYIQGDIKLWDVQLENNTAENGSKRIYQNPGYLEEQ